MRQLTFRLPNALIARLDAMAEAREIDRTKIRRILEAGASGEAPPPTEPPTEEELLDSAG